MPLNTQTNGSSKLYTLFDNEEKVITYPSHYLKRLIVDKRPAESQRQIAYVIKKYCEWIENSAFFQGLNVDEALSIVDKDDILDWITDQRQAGLSEVTIHNRELLIREMYKWFTTEEAGIRKEIPWSSRCFTRSQHKNIPRFLTTQQVITLLNNMHNENQRAAAHLMFDTGLRISEMIRMKRNDLPDESDYPEWANYYALPVLGSKPFDGSGFKKRFTIISRPMLARIRKYHSTARYKLARGWKMDDLNKPVFLNIHGETLSKTSIYKGIKSAWKRAGLDAESVYPHRLRHGTAYSVLRSELGKELLDNLLILRGMLGHENIKTTEIYGSIPIVALQTICSQPVVHMRFKEADDIFQATYLPEYKNIQKRGRKK